MIKLTIDGREVRLEGPATVLEAARSAGIHIPTLCDHEAVESFGGCRVCLVEVEKMPKLQTACTLRAADGMAVRTDTEAVLAARRAMLELLLINHPLDCPVCDKAGECELQDLVGRCGPGAGRFGEAKRRKPVVQADPLIARNMERCVLCARCVRMCCDVQGAHAISVVSRGGSSSVEPFSGDVFDCEYCGNCVTVCPVGALQSRLCTHNYRPWAIDRETPAVCGYCGVGCSFVIQARDESINRVVPRFGLGLNDGLLCALGRFGYEFPSSPERLKAPMLRKGGELREVSWDEALDFVAGALSGIRDKEGGGAIAGIASPRCANEDDYAFQSFLRGACRTDSVDSVSGMGFAAAQKHIESLLGPGTASGRIADLGACDAVLVAGGDPTEVNPVLGLAIRKAARTGAKVAVLGGAPGLKRSTTVRVSPPLFGEAEVLEAALSRIFKERGTAGSRPALEGWISRLGEFPPEDERVSRGAEAIAGALRESKRPAIVIGMDIVQRSDGHRALAAVAGLAHVLRAGLFLLCERPNEQGCLDMGCTSGKGPSLLGIMRGVRERKVRALYVMGANPAFDVPGSGAAAEALRSLDLLVVQDIFLTETARLAHAVLPAVAWSEKQGTFTNLERRVQRLDRAVMPRFGREDWRIIADVSGRMGRPMGWSSAEAVFDEIARSVPAYQGLSYAGLGSGESFVLPREGALDRAPAPAAAKRPEVREGECYLSLDRPLFHSGTLSRRSPALNKICPEPRVRIGPELARGLGLASGDRVRLRAGGESLLARLSVEEGLEEGRAFLGNNFEGRGVFALLKGGMDPVTGAAALEGCAVTLEKAA